MRGRKKVHGKRYIVVQQQRAKVAKMTEDGLKMCSVMSTGEPHYFFSTDAADRAVSAFKSPSSLYIVEIKQ